ncbi:lariat debranching enzyme [Coemansia sp. RSA 1358]|nr:lariat debranching enzyme [Coemansia sp. RSA 1358]
MLDDIYRQLHIRETSSGEKIDLLIICGDFQAIRNVTDLECMSCPDKYKQIGGFYRYYTGERVAPVPTIFVGGNHEASNHIRELYYGGWVAPNIYYLGNSGVIRFGGLRIGGISGIFKDFDYIKGYYERPPFRGHSRASMHHVRSFEVFKMLQIRKPLDVVVSHDWPQNIEKFGNVARLLRKKPFFEAESKRGELGSPVNALLMERLRPAWWFSAHLHVRFEANLTPSDTIFDKGWNNVPPYNNPQNGANSVLANAHAANSAEKFDNSSATVHGSGLNKDEIAIDSFSEDESEPNPQGTTSTVSNRLPLNLPPPKYSIPDTSELVLEAAISDTKQQNIPFEKASAAEVEDDPVDQTVSSPQVSGRTTKFLALDKCLPRREFMEVIDIEVGDGYDPNIAHLQLEYDPEWLAILRLCNRYLPLEESSFILPSEVMATLEYTKLPLFTDSMLDRELDWVNANIFADGPVFVPPNFMPMAPTPPQGTPDYANFGLAARVYGQGGRGSRPHGRGRGRGGYNQSNTRDSIPWQGPRPDIVYPNPQVDEFCQMVGLQDNLTQRRHQ